MTKRLYTTHIRYRLHIVSYTPSLSPHATMLSKWQIANGMKNIFYFFFILAISPNFACLLWKWARFFSILCSFVPPWPRSNAVACSLARSNVIFFFLSTIQSFGVRTYLVYFDIWGRVCSAVGWAFAPWCSFCYHCAPIYHCCLGVKPNYFVCQKCIIWK